MAHPNGYAIIPDDPFAPVVLGEAMHTQTGDTVVRIDRDVVHERLAGRGISLDPAEWAAAVASPNRDWYRFPFVVVDLFAGAGGSSTGILRALKALRVPVLLLQINHWARAIETQIVNFPNAIHLNASVETPDPREIIPWGYIDYLCASPECCTFSVARGKKKIREQSRSSAAFLLTWLERITVARFAFENVREWKTSWGRLNKAGTATLKGYEGEYYRAFFRRIKQLGYPRVIDAVLNSANYGTPQTRLRLFVMAKLGQKPIAPPPATHTAYPAKYPHLKPHRVAREIIDFDDKGESSFCRFGRDGSSEGPHAVASLQRTRAGYERQIPKRPGAAAYARAFELLIPIAREYHTNTPPSIKSLEKAKPTRADEWRTRYNLPTRNKQLTPKECDQILAASAVEWRERYGLDGTGLLSAGARREIHTLNVEASREATKITFSQPIMDFVYEIADEVADSFTMGERTHSSARVVDLPVHAATSAVGGGLTLTQPTIMGQHAGSIARTVDDHTFMTIAGGGAISLAQPFSTRANASQTSVFDDATRDLSRPFQTIDSKGCIGLAQPVLSDVGHGEADLRRHELEKPVNNLTAKAHLALSQPTIELAGPALVEVAHGDHEGHERRPKSLDAPLGAIHAGGGKFGVADPAIEAEAFILSRHGDNGGDRSSSLERPALCITGSGGGYFVEPMLLPQHSGAPMRETTKPAPTIVGIARIGLNQGADPEPFYYEPHGERETQAERVHTLDKPALTVTPRGIGTMVQPADAKTIIKDVQYKPKVTINGHVFVLDSFFRMLRNRELARAQDLVDEARGYDFILTGSTQEQTKQLGNAVPSNVMEAIARMLCDDVVGLDEDTPLIDVLLAPMPLAETFGIYNERIIRRESGEALPQWFTPKENALHVGIHEPGGRHTYLELAENEAARTSLHPYEVDIVDQTDQATALELFPLAA